MHPDGRVIDILKSDVIVATISTLPDHDYVREIRYFSDSTILVGHAREKLFILARLIPHVCYTINEIFGATMRCVAKEIKAKDVFVDDTRAIFTQGRRTVRVKLDDDCAKIGMYHYRLSAIRSIMEAITVKFASFVKGMPVSVFENHIARLKEEIAQIYPALAAVEEIQIINVEKFAFCGISWFILADDWKSSKKLRTANRIYAIRADVAALLPQPISEEMTPHLV